mmetsp:Transcript_12954/g.13071  ORF Transcript_12954/g.13071 Transcript_12954/m.13071 type:complete len:118 (-) Transcript_12954:450-803(-)
MEINIKNTIKRRHPTTILSIGPWFAQMSWLSEIVETSSQLPYFAPVIPYHIPIAAACKTTVKVAINIETTSERKRKPLTSIMTLYIQMTSAAKQTASSTAYAVPASLRSLKVEQKPE